MLESIQVKNVALIDEAEIEFGKGLNIITGETGAGKSILLNSVQLALGAKADKDLIGQYGEEAYVELVFSVDSMQKKRMKEMEVSVGKDNAVILQRRLSQTKSTCKVNGESVTVKNLQEIAECLIDVHGQRDHQLLLKPSAQERLLDDYIGEEISEDLTRIAKLYQDYQKQAKELEESMRSDMSVADDIDFIRFEADEIAEADLKPGEDVRLEEKFERLQNSGKLQENVQAVIGMIADPNGNGVQSAISRSAALLSEAAVMDDKLADANKQLLDVESLLQDVSSELDRYLDRFGEDFEDPNEIEARLNLINKLKVKYGNSIEAILEAYEDRMKMIERLEDRDAYMEKLKENHVKTKEEYDALSLKLHEIRTEAAERFGKAVERALYELNFIHCNFEVQTEYGEEMTKYGRSSSEFYISLNPGEPLKPLSTVASGGELSRIMLALKTVFASKDGIGTLIFDEIDAGISGLTAWKVSEKLGLLARDRQVLCITHLPQIAAMADSHYRIEKTTDGENTRTQVHKVGKEDALKEIGRLLGTDQITDAVLANAKEMKEKAEEVKESWQK
ncbi:MAG: DNA repair protein RecN [Lachnospiraceae bacterium]|nr:DNA repair protein RecN [Lachnospiraceae bacterium]